MNKKLLTGAVGAALVAAPMLAAQADVKVYGMAHVSLDVVSCDGPGCREGTGTGTSQTFFDENDMYMANNSSRFGIKASEDLGGGLKGVAQFEIFVDQSDDTTVNANRNNYVGLEGGFGKVWLGRVDSSQKDVGGIADLFYREQLGESRSIINLGGSDGRSNNSLTYYSPKLGPVTIKAQYVVPDTAANDAAQMNVNATGTFGPVTGGLAYWKNETASTATNAEDTTGWRLGVSVPLGGFKITGLYESVDAIGNVDGRDQDAWGLGAEFKMGNNDLKAQYYVADERDDVKDSGGSMWAIGVDHNFSKTFVGYVVYASLDNDDAAQFSLGGNGHGETYTPAAGESSSGFSLGFRYAF